MDKTTYREYIDLSIIDEALHELTSGERYAVESFAFLLKVKYLKEGKDMPVLMQQLRKLTRDVIQAVDEEDI